MRCHFVDERVDFLALLGQKLGADFSLVPAQLEIFQDMEQSKSCDVLIIGLPPSDSEKFEERLELLKRVVLNPAGVPVIAFLATHDRQVIRDAIAAGAYDYFVESSPLEELRIVLRRAVQLRELNQELERLRALPLPARDFGWVVGTDSVMTEILQFASKIAASDATVLITGETGTGKELLAQLIHSASSRARFPFVPVACSSLPETLIETELFGHERGAFTGAVSMRRGRFEAADRGTLFLDEAGDLPSGLQIKLLRVLQERTFERVGSNQSRPMEARIICATHRNLPLLVASGAFRADLYYRLNTIEIELPPLRVRRDDVVVLAHSFLQTYAERHKRPARRIGPAVLSAFRMYPWPGNVRELQHVIERAVVVCDGPEIRLEHMPRALFNWTFEERDSSWENEVRNFKRQLLRKSLEQSGNNKAQAARTLRISRSSLHRLIDELEIPPLPGLNEQPS
ncbi:MAG: sigma-54 dependent transcriptional regulator [Terriglobales bacterium]